MTGVQTCALPILPTDVPGKKEVAALLDRIIYIKLEKRLESYDFLSQIRNTAR